MYFPSETIWQNQPKYMNNFGMTETVPFSKLPFLEKKYPAVVKNHSKK